MGRGWGQDLPGALAAAVLTAAGPLWEAMAGILFWSSSWGNNVGCSGECWQREAFMAGSTEPSQAAVLVSRSQHRQEGGLQAGGKWQQAKESCSLSEWQVETTHPSVGKPFLKKQLCKPEAPQPVRDAGEEYSNCPPEQTTPVYLKPGHVL